MPQSREGGNGARTGRLQWRSRGVSGSVETSYVLKVGSLGIAYGFDVECERNRG